MMEFIKHFFHLIFSSFIIFPGITRSKKSRYKDKWVFYRDKRNNWRWRRIARNGKIVGASHEGYQNKKDCVENAIRAGYSI